MRVRSLWEFAWGRELADRPRESRLPVPADGHKRRPGFSLSPLAEHAALSQFIAAFDWVLSEINKTENPDSA
jgi:hypothetical protein